MSTQAVSVRPEYSHSTLNWITATVMVIFHVLAVAAFFFFSWTNLLVAIALHWLAVGFGISLGYHRLHTHRGYKTSKAFEYFLAVCGTLTLEGGRSSGSPRTACIISIPIMTATRIRRATAGSGHTSAGFCSAIRTTTTPS